MKILKEMLENLEIPKPTSGLILSSSSVKSLCMDEVTFFQHLVPKKYSHACLDFMDKQPAQLIEFGKKWAESPKSLYLYGSPGNGKTHFSFALIREVFRKCKTKVWPRYFTSTELDSRLHKALIDEGDGYLIRNLSTEDILFIDDFGRETKSDRIRRQYFEIINFRYSHELPTILTSNFGLDYIAKELGEVISSRIQEGQIIRFTGPDLRNPELTF